MKYPGVFVSVALAATIQAQHPAAPSAADQPRTVLRIGVDLVRVDAIVTDERGRHVTDLTAEDFEVLQDGELQTVSTFTYVATSPDATGAASVPPVVPDRARGAGAAIPAAPPAPVARDQVRRTMAVIVDDLGLSLESTYRVRDTIRRFLDTQVQAGDLVAILRTGAGIGALQQFTTDRRLLYAAADRVRWNMMTRIAPFEAPSETDAKIAALQTEQFTVGTLGAIQYVIRGVAELPGRKSIVLFSDGFKVTDADGSYGRVLDELRRVIDASTRAGVVIYSIDARGLAATGPTASDAGPAAMRGRQADLRATQGGLAMLATETGGLFTRDRNDLGAGFRAVLDDQRGYYLLGYVPRASTFSSKTTFHPLTVRVKRSGLRVRSRSGFYGHPDDSPLRKTAAGRMADALTSPFGGGDIGLRLSSFFGQAEKIGPVVQSYLHVNARDLSFAEDPAGTRSAHIELLAITFDDNGGVANQHSSRYVVTLAPDRYARALTSGFVYTMRVPVKRPGPYQLRVALRDVKSDRIGAASHFIEVPDVRNGRLTLSGLLIQGAGQQPAAGQTSDRVEDSDPNASVAVRAFRKGSGANYACFVYNAKRASSGQPQIDIELRLYRDGAEVFHNPPSALQAPPAGSPVMAAGLLRFGAAFPPGNYLLELTVIDRLAKKHGRATQTIDFDVID